MSGLPEKSGTIKVYTRPRPTSTYENELKQSDSIVHLVQPQKLFMKQGYTEKRYNFDFVFEEDSSNLEVYDRVVAPMVHNVIEGYNCTVVTYGPSASGKTFTLLGPKPNPNVPQLTLQEQNFGLIQQAATHLFKELSKSSIKVDYTVRLSMVEIFNEEVRDLLNDCTQMRLYADPVNKGSVYMKDVTKLTICSVKNLMKWLEEGLSKHKKRAVKINQPSTYFALLFAFYVDIREMPSRGEQIIKASQLYFIDTPASENANVDLRVRETATLSRGLVTLNNVIKALGQKSQHVPYTDSKLTRILQNSFGGNCKTAIVATYLPCTANWNETMSTLDLVQSVKSIKNTPRVNINRKPADLYQELQEEVNKLKTELSAARSGVGFYVTQETYTQLQEASESKNKQIVELIGKIKNLEEHKQLLSDQSNALNTSFAHTRDYLDRLNVELAQKEEIVKEGNRKVAELRRREAELHQATTTLQGVCETITAREEMYYNKFVAKARTNENNIKISKRMVDLALQYLDEDLRLAKKCGIERSTFFNTVDVTCQHLLEEQNRNVKIINTMPEEIREHAQQPITDQLPSASICEKYYNVNREIINSGKEVELAMASLSSDFNRVIVDDEPHFDETFNNVEATVAGRETTTNNCLQQLGLISNIIVNNNVQELCEDPHVAEEIALSHETELLERVLDNLSNEIKFPQDGINYSELEKTVTSCLETSEKNMNKYMDALNVMMIGCDSVASAWSDKISANEESMDERTDDFVSTLEGQLDNQNHLCQQKISTWDDVFTSVGNNVGKNMEPVHNLEDTFNSTNAIVREKAEELAQFVQDNINKIEELYDGIDATGHNGDTPVRSKISVDINTSSIQFKM